MRLSAWNTEHAIKVKMMLEDLMYNTPVVTLGIEDIYEYRDPELVRLIQTKYNEYLASQQPVEDDF